VIPTFPNVRMNNRHPSTSENKSTLIYPMCNILKTYDCNVLSVKIFGQRLIAPQVHTMKLASRCFLCAVGLPLMPRGLPRGSSLSVGC
jgi:hypothetical protein